MRIIDPVKFTKRVWPHINLYDKQVEILYSLRDNDETYVPAGNQLGKDFISAVAVLWFMCSRRPARVVTTSVKHDQLDDVLWGEIRKLIEDAVVKLPLQYNHMKIRQQRDDGSLVPKAELVGQVCRHGEALLGRHLPRPDGIPTTLTVFDEASGIFTPAYDSSDTWSHRKLIIGNPYPCSNFFFQYVKAGDTPRASGVGFYRKVIRIKATDSPNVQLAEREIALGREPSLRELVPGVLDYTTYKKKRLLLDKVKQCICLDAEFYEGAEALLYPPEVLNRAEALWAKLQGKKRQGAAMGVDAAEGGDSTVWVIIDEFGILEWISLKTPDTSVIQGTTIDLIRKHKLDPNKVMFDRGGGGKQHADYLREKGFAVMTVDFGGSATKDRRRRRKTLVERIEEDETRTTYKNKRAEMYGMLSIALASEDGFCIPQEYTDMRHQLSPIPKQYNNEGTMYLPPKNKRTASSKERTMHDLIGRSPDDADALVLANYGLHGRHATAMMPSF